MIIRNIMEIDVKSGIKLILKQIEDAYAIRPKLVTCPKPLLVAVSKTKPVEMIIDAYSSGQEHFGENYVQELVEKSRNPQILQKCPNIKWHFIGHLQNNKVNKIIKVPNLYMVQTVDNEKLACTLNAAWERVERDDKQPLKILIQINTSGEEEKHGVHPNEAPILFKQIKERFPNLQVEGVMTIGAFGHDYNAGPNPDFVSLMSLHSRICDENAIARGELHVSMGMSDDFVNAIEMGSTIVRVGSSIFGQRSKKA